VSSAEAAEEAAGSSRSNGAAAEARAAADYASFHRQVSPLRPQLFALLRRRRC